MSGEMYFGTLMERVDALEGEIERLKRDLLRSLANQPRAKRVKSLFGSVRGGDVTEKMIDEAKQSLFQSREVF